VAIFQRMESRPVVFSCLLFAVVIAVTIAPCAFALESLRYDHIDADTTISATGQSPGLRGIWPTPP
jgi:hypothetical protein